MGARVIVTAGEIAPHSFAHPLLATVRVPPQPMASLEQPTIVGDKADKGAPGRASEAKPADIPVKSASAEPAMELRSTVGHAVMSDAPASNAMAQAPAETPTATADTPKADDIAAKPAETTTAEAKPVEAAEPPKLTEKAATDEKPADKAEAPKSEPALP